MTTKTNYDDEETIFWGINLNMYGMCRLNGVWGQ